jgi:hypothetical protein
MVNKYMKKCSISLAISAMQVKTTTVTFHTVQGRMVIFNKTNSSKYWQGCMGGASINSWGNCKFVQPLWKLASKFLKNLQVELPYD